MARYKFDHAIMKRHRTRAYVEWNGVDDTDAVHAAIATGRGEIVFRGQDTPYIVGPITLQSNQRLIFHHGADVTAKSGSFTDYITRMFYLNSLTNVALLGRDTTFTMLRDDYTTAPPYTDSETFTADTDDVLTLSSANATIQVANTRVKVSTTGTLPAGLSSTTTYYVRAISGATCKLSTTASDVGLVNITSTGSGTHTITKLVSEYKIGIAMLGCTNVHISGITVKDCGGDGLYIGGTTPCRNVTVRNCSLENNYRNNMSVINVDGLLVEDVDLIEANGTTPETGLDIEPNLSTDVLKNCVFRRVNTSANVQCGIYLMLDNLTSASDDVDIVFEDCNLTGDSTAGIGVARSAFSIRSLNNGGVDGLITLNDVTIEDSALQAFGMTNKQASILPVITNRLSIINPSAAVAARPPIFFTSGGTGVNPMGGVTFNDLSITDAVDRDPLDYGNYSTPAIDVSSIDGDLALTYDGTTTDYDLTTEVLTGWMADYAPAP